CAKSGGDDEGSAPLLEAEYEHESGGGGRHHDGKGELDTSESGQIDGGEAGACQSTAGGDVVHLRRRAHDGAHGSHHWRWITTADVDEKQVRSGCCGGGGDISRVGNEEAVTWCRRELLGDADVVEGDRPVLVRG